MKKEDSLSKNEKLLRTEESRAGGGGRGPLEVVLSNVLLKAGSRMAGCSVMSSWVFNFSKDRDSTLLLEFM